MIKEVLCSKCGKNFVPAPQHIYRDEKGCYCSWTCYNHRKDGRKPLKFKKVNLYSQSGTLIKTFTSATDAAEFTGLSIKNIQRACREKSVYSGYFWRYENDLP